VGLALPCPGVIFISGSAVKRPVIVTVFIFVSSLVGWCWKEAAPGKRRRVRGAQRA
jgi:hypothetical protein